MRYEVFVVENGDEFFIGHDQHIATFENVDEEFMDEVVDFISMIRDVKCRYEDAPLKSVERNDSADVKPEAGAQPPKREHNKSSLTCLCDPIIIKNKTQGLLIISKRCPVHKHLLQS